MGHPTSAGPPPLGDAAAAPATSLRCGGRHFPPRKMASESQLQLKLRVAAVAASVPPPGQRGPPRRQVSMRNGASAPGVLLGRSPLGSLQSELNILRNSGGASGAASQAEGSSGCGAASTGGRGGRSGGGDHGSCNLSVGGGGSNGSRGNLSAVGDAGSSLSGGNTRTGGCGGGGAAAAEGPCDSRPGVLLHVRGGAADVTGSDVSRSSDSRAVSLGESGIGGRGRQNSGVSAAKEGRGSSGGVSNLGGERGTSSGSAEPATAPLASFSGASRLNPGDEGEHGQSNHFVSTRRLCGSPLGGHAGATAAEQRGSLPGGPAPPPPPPPAPAPSPADPADPASPFSPAARGEALDPALHPAQLPPRLSSDVSPFTPVLHMPPAPPPPRRCAETAHQRGTEAASSASPRSSSPSGGVCGLRSSALHSGAQPVASATPQSPPPALATAQHPCTVYADPPVLPLGTPSAAGGAAAGWRVHVLLDPAVLAAAAARLGSDTAAATGPGLSADTGGVGAVNAGAVGQLGAPLLLAYVDTACCHRCDGGRGASCAQGGGECSSVTQLVLDPEEVDFAAGRVSLRLPPHAVHPGGRAAGAGVGVGECGSGGGGVAGCVVHLHLFLAGAKLVAPGSAGVSAGVAGAHADVSGGSGGSGSGGSTSSTVSPAAPPSANAGSPPALQAAVTEWLGSAKLLLLPPAAAAELHGVWRAMVAETRRLTNVEPAVAESAVATAAPTAAAVAPVATAHMAVTAAAPRFDPVRAAAYRDSMQPLLEDIALALRLPGAAEPHYAPGAAATAGGGADAGGGLEAVVAAGSSAATAASGQMLLLRNLLQYVRDQGLHACGELLNRATGLWDREDRVEAGQAQASAQTAAVHQPLPSGVVGSLALEASPDTDAPPAPMESISAVAAAVQGSLSPDGGIPPRAARPGAQATGAAAGVASVGHSSPVAADIGTAAVAPGALAGTAPASLELALRSSSPVRRTLALLSQPDGPPPGLSAPSTPAATAGAPAAEPPAPGAAQPPTLALLLTLLAWANAAVRCSAAACRCTLAGAAQIWRHALAAAAQLLRGFPDRRQEAAFAAWSAARAGEGSAGLLCTQICMCVLAGAVADLRLVLHGISQPVAKGAHGTLWMAAPLTAHCLRPAVLAKLRRLQPGGVQRRRRQQGAEAFDVARPPEPAAGAGARAVTSVCMERTVPAAGGLEGYDGGLAVGIDGSGRGDGGDDDRWIHAGDDGGEGLVWRDTLAAASVGFIASVCSLLTYTCSRPCFDVRQDDLAVALTTLVTRAVLPPMLTQLRLPVQLLASAGMAATDVIYANTLYGGGEGGTAVMPMGKATEVPLAAFAWGVAGLIALSNLAISAHLEYRQRRHFLSGMGAG